MTIEPSDGLLEIKTPNGIIQVDVLEECEAIAPACHLHDEAPHACYDMIAEHLEKKLGFKVGRLVAQNYMVQINTAAEVVKKNMNPEPDSPGTTASTPVDSQTEK